MQALEELQAALTQRAMDIRIAIEAWASDAAPKLGQARGNAASEVKDALRRVGGFFEGRERAAVELKTAFERAGQQTSSAVRTAWSSVNAGPTGGPPAAALANRLGAMLRSIVQAMPWLPECSCKELHLQPVELVKLTKFATRISIAKCQRTGSLVKKSVRAACVLNRCTDRLLRQYPSCS